MAAPISVMTNHVFRAVDFLVVGMPHIHTHYREMCDVWKCEFRFTFQPEMNRSIAAVLNWKFFESILIIEYPLESHEQNARWWFGSIYIGKWRIVFDRINSFFFSFKWQMSIWFYATGTRARNWIQWNWIDLVLFFSSEWRWTIESEIDSIFNKQ